jgi:hypothetical protein
LALFLFNSLAASVHEVLSVKFLQKMDNRLKGDPTTLRFSKEFLESCDEAQQLEIYKAGYKAFQFAKNAFMVILVLTLLLNLLFEVGGLAVFIICMCLIILIGSYNFYAITKAK